MKRPSGMLNMKIQIPLILYFAFRILLDSSRLFGFLYFQSFSGNLGILCNHPYPSSDYFVSGRAEFGGRSASKAVGIPKENFQKLNFNEML